MYRLPDQGGRAQVRPQFPHRLVLLVADALRRQRQLRRDVLHRPALEAHLQDLLLPIAEQLRGRLFDLGAVLRPFLRLRVAAVADHAEQLRRALAAALRPLLDGVDGAEELAALVALALE